MSEAGIRWGLDAEQRGGFTMSGFAHNTWRSGLDRILLGVAMSGDGHRHLGRGLPLDDVGSGDLDLVGRFAELLNRLETALTALAGADPVEEWMAGLHEGVRGLTDVPPDDAWQVPQLERELARATDAASDGAGVELRLADVRALLTSRLRGRPTRANFRTGTLTVCTMVPMRSVPHRVVCLVGLDDGLFPRSATVDGDDVLARRPLTGERDVRSEDRQLLLDAVLAATETLVVTYTGANEHSRRRPAPRRTPRRAARRPRPDHRDPGARRGAGAPPAAALRPPQPHPRWPGGGEPVQLRHRRPRGGAGGGRRAPPAAGVPARPAGRPPGEDVSLADLKAFLVHPVRAFLRSRLDVSAPLEAEEVADAIPVDLDGLGRWAIGDRLVTAVIAGENPYDVMLAEQLAGSLPPFRLGELTLERITAEVQDLYRGTTELRAGEARAHDVAVDLGDGRRLVGTVSDVYGNRLVRVGYSRLRARQRLSTWVDLLALSAALPDQNWTGHTVGKGSAGAQRATAGPLDHTAVDRLRGLVELRDLGLCRPLAAPLATAHAWAEAHARELRGDDRSPAHAAAREWVTDPNNSWGIEGEDADPWHVRVYGERAPLSRLLDDGLATHAWQIWEPLVTGGERVGPL